MGARKFHRPRSRAQRGDQMRMLFVAVRESAYGTKRTWRDVAYLSAFGAKRTCTIVWRWPPRPRLPSRPGEFHPEPLTEPDLSLSTYPARAIARRLPPSAARSPTTTNGAHGARGAF